MFPAADAAVAAAPAYTGIPGTVSFYRPAYIRSSITSLPTSGFPWLSHVNGTAGGSTFSPRLDFGLAADWVITYTHTGSKIPLGLKR